MTELPWQKVEEGMRRISEDPQMVRRHTRTDIFCKAYNPDDYAPVWKIHHSQEAYGVHPVKFNGSSPLDRSYW